MNKIIIFVLLLFTICLSQVDIKSRPVMTYDYRMTIDTTEVKAADSTADTMSVTVWATAQLAANLHDVTNTFRVYVSYERLDITKFDVQTELQINTSTIEDQSIEGFYIATVDATSGKVIELQQPEGQNDKLINWITVDLIKQAFPDLRNSLFGPQLLSQAEILEEDHLGQVHPHFSESQQGDNVILNKWYNKDDFKEIKYDLGGQAPEVNYEQTTVIDKKSNLIKRSHSEYKINIATQINYQLQQTQDQEPVEEILGEIYAQIESDLVVVDVGTKTQNLMDMIDYVSTKQFSHVDLNNDGGKAEIFDGSNIDLENDQILNNSTYLQQSSSIYQYTYDVFKKTLLGQTFGIEARYNNYGDKSGVSAHVVLNSRSLLKLFEFQYQHCPGAHEKNYNKDLNFKLFEVNYPILAVLSIKVTAYIQISYGYNWYYGGNDSNTGCLIQFQPYVKPGIQATGSASVLGIAEGGIYASGTVANSYLLFKAEVRNAFTTTSKKLGGYVQLIVKIIPFEYEVGAYYKLVKCDLRKLFRWPPKFKKICSMGNAHKISLLTGKVGNTYEHTIFKWSFTI